MQAKARQLTRASSGKAVHGSKKRPFARHLERRVAVLVKLSRVRERGHDAGLHARQQVRGRRFELLARHLQRPQREPLQQVRQVHRGVRGRAQLDAARFGRREQTVPRHAVLRLEGPHPHSAACVVKPTRARQKGAPPQKKERLTATRTSQLDV
jgi:hypothetical protein